MEILVNLFQGFDVAFDGLLNQLVGIGHYILTKRAIEAVEFIGGDGFADMSDLAGG